MYLFFGLGAAGLFYCCSPLLVTHLFKIDTGNWQLAITALRLSGAGLLVRMVDEALVACLHGCERFDLAAKVSIPINILSVLLNLFLMSRGYGIIPLLAGTIVMITVGALVKAYLCHVHLIGLGNPLPTFSTESLREMFSFGFYSWLQGVSAILLHQTDRLLIAALLGTTPLTYYAVSLQLAQQIHSILARGSAFLFPLASAFTERQSWQQLRHIYYRALTFVTLAAIALGLPLFFLADTILELWMGAAFAQQATPILRVLIFAMVMLSTSIVPSYFLNGAGWVRFSAAASLA